MKCLQNTKSRKAKEADLEARQAVLKRAWEQASDEDRAILDKMYVELAEQWVYLRRSNKEWLYNFKSGGWNSSEGADREIAIQNAKEQWALTTLQIDEDSFRISTDEEKKHLLSLFY